MSCGVELWCGGGGGVGGVGDYLRVVERFCAYQICVSTKSLRRVAQSFNTQEPATAAEQ